MNKLYLKTLLLCLFSFIGITSFAYDCEVNGVYYNLNKTSKTAFVTYKSYSSSKGYNADYTPTTITIPSSITVGSVKYTVTSIGSSAFRNCRSLTSVTIPNSVTSIGSYAFRYCSGLTEVSFADGADTLYIDAGYWSSDPMDVGYECPFNESPLERIYLGRYFICSGRCEGQWGDTYTAYGSPFYYIATIKNVTISNSVTSIGNHAFYGCIGLTSVAIPNSVTRII